MEDGRKNSGKREGYLKNGLKTNDVWSSSGNLVELVLSLLLQLSSIRETIAQQRLDLLLPVGGRRRMVDDEKMGMVRVKEVRGERKKRPLTKHEQSFRFAFFRTRS
jgi:hypothetical protein